jgi:hypothetical protein
MTTPSNSTRRWLRTAAQETWGCIFVIPLNTNEYFWNTLWKKSSTEAPSASWIPANIRKASS